MTWIVLFSTLLFAGSPAKTQKLQFANGVKLEVEVARSDAEREVGLMNRTEMKDNHGMLFEFPTPQRLSFWMKNTFIPLSIAYFDKDKVLQEIHDMKPQNLMEKEQDLRSYPSQCMCQYALEVNQGWFAKNKIKKGDKFTLSSL